MTGLDLESFLELLRADVGAWLTLGLVLLLLGLMAWTSWGSRRALRKCLVLSIGAHVGLVLYGSTHPMVASMLEGDVFAKPKDASVARVAVAPVVEGDRTASKALRNGLGPSGRPASPLDVPPELPLLETSKPLDLRPPSTESDPIPRAVPAPLAPTTAVADLGSSLPDPSSPRTSELSAPTAAPASADPVESAAPKAATARVDSTPFPSERLKPDRAATDAGKSLAGPSRAAPGLPGLSRTPGLADALAPAPATERRPSETASNAAPSDASTEIPTAKPISAGSGAVGPLLADRGARPRPEPGSTAVKPTTPGRPGIPGLGATAPELKPPALEAPNTAAPRPSSDITAGPALDSSQPSSTVPAPVKPTTTVDNRPGADLRLRSRPRTSTDSGTMIAARTPFDGSTPLPTARVAPTGAGNLPFIQGASGLSRPLTDIPAIYRSRLDANRTALAQRSGATRDSEQAVERALDWLSRHQDADGRWDGGTARYKDGSVAEGDDDYMVHCPPGDLCYGPCYYWEGDTALTGLALLAFLGSGYTHMDGKYAETVGKGIDFLRLQQKPDGDLRGRSVAVGMYCHAMATLALCEAYALTGDPKLRVPVERAVAFVTRSRAKDGLAWRYAPGAPIGDTSILGWVVMVLKSAKEVGITIEPDVRLGASTWLNRVSTGASAGLAKYQPGEKVTPTMTAEAWVCREFLEIPSPAARNAEAADYLLENSPIKGPFNLYYWYYGTLAMFQHGGDPWNRWNREVRDGIVERQRKNGHAAGSWDPDESQYGTHGGRIYCTALATLTLEVYYRYILK